MIVAINDAMSHLLEPARSAKRLEEAARRARAAGEPGLERLARSYRVVAQRLQGRRRGLDAEVRDLLEEDDSEHEYDRYLCIWAASLVALVDRDGPGLRRLMDAQLADLMASGLRENWLTMYWEALALIAGTGGLPAPAAACM